MLGLTDTVYTICRITKSALQDLVGFYERINNDITPEELASLGAFVQSLDMPAEDATE